MSRAAVGRLADLFVRRAVSLAVCVAGGKEEKAEEEVGQYGESTERTNTKKKERKGGEKKITEVCSVAAQAGALIRECETQR